MSSKQRALADQYSYTRSQRLNALRDRLAWLDRKIALTPLAAGLPFLRAEREATHWAIETLSALVDCHSLKWAIEREKQRQAEQQQDEAVQQ